MKRISTSALALAAAAFFSAGAGATDILDKRYETYADQPAGQAQVNWTGLWVGAVGGYQFSNTEGNFNYTETELEDQGSPTVEEFMRAGIDGLGQDGFFGEAQIGFDYQFNNRFAFRVMGGYNINDAEFTADYSVGDGPVTHDSGSVSFSQEWGAVVGAGIVFIKSNDTAFYGIGGLSLGELGDIEVTDEAGVTTGFAPEDADLTGWFIEAGAEHRLTGNIFGTLAGRYTDNGSATIASGSEPCHGDECAYSLTADKRDLSVMVGLKAKIGGF